MDEHFDAFFVNVSLRLDQACFMKFLERHEAHDSNNQHDELPKVEKVAWTVAYLDQVFIEAKSTIKLTWNLLQWALPRRSAKAYCTTHKSEAV